MVLVKLSDIRFAYDDKNVLKNASLTINRGEYVGLIGANGSAKSTLLKIILGVLTPQSGTVELFGQPIAQFNAWGKIGYVAQNANGVNQQFPATVEEVVSAGLYPIVGTFGRVRAAHRKRVDEVLNIVEISDLKKRLIGNLSGGQRQKVFIARALVSSPEVLFLDEPTVGIDASSQIQFYELLETLNKNHGVTIVIVSHDIGVISEKVTRIACMADGIIHSHNSCCAVPAAQFIEQVYGDKMHLLHHHHHETGSL